MEKRSRKRSLAAQKSFSILLANLKPNLCPDRFIADINATFMQKIFYIFNERGNLTYSITASWMVSGKVLK